uniref:Uncharacterized protein n=1 Tax=Zea mays TaxID=4577 RepID=A0A804MWF5_MAIZE
MTDLDGNIVVVPNPSGRGPGYRYFGAARKLPGVRELFDKPPEMWKRRTRYEIHKRINARGRQAPDVALLQLQGPGRAAGNSRPPPPPPTDLRPSPGRPRRLRGFAPLPARGPPIDLHRPSTPVRPSTRRLTFACGRCLAARTAAGRSPASDRQTPPLHPASSATVPNHPAPLQQQSRASSRFSRPALSRRAGTRPRHPQERHPSGFKRVAALLSSSSPAPPVSPRSPSVLSLVPLMQIWSDSVILRWMVSFLAHANFLASTVPAATPMPARRPYARRETLAATTPRIPPRDAATAHPPAMPHRTRASAASLRAREPPAQPAATRTHSLCPLRHDRCRMEADGGELRLASFNDTCALVSVLVSARQSRCPAD